MDVICKSNKPLRPHLTKEQRLPRYLKEVEKIIQSVKSCKKNYKTVLANSRLRGSVFKKVYNLTVNVLKNYGYIQKIIDEMQLLAKEKYLRREIASILIYEVIFGNGTPPGESKLVKTIQLYENDIRYAHEVLQTKHTDYLNIEMNIPRYARVHTLVTTVPYVVKDLVSYGFNQVPYNDLPEEKYLELVRNLEKGSFLIDYHFKDILVFEHHENLVSLDLYKKGHLFLQDKSSYIPVHVLDPQPTSAVLDACAAPGMKTIHIADKMKNKGTLIACERDASRFESLKQILDYGSVKICKTLRKDFTLIDPSDQAYSNIEYILLDPSCSGSGMVNRMDEVTDTEDSKSKERLKKLAGFQIILLKHALKFPSVKRVVYSTCSVHEEENEYVVCEALKAFSGTFKLALAMPEWSHRGLENYKFGKLCIRTDPKKHLTNGFFVAMFERTNWGKHTRYLSQNNKKHVKLGVKTETYYEIDSGLKNPKKKFSKLRKSYETTVTEINECFPHEDDSSINSAGGHNTIQPYEKSVKRGVALLNKHKGFESYDQYAKDEHMLDMNYVQKNKKKHKKRKSSKHVSDKLNLEFPSKLSEPQLKCFKLEENINATFTKVINDNSNPVVTKDKAKQNKHENLHNVFETTEFTKQFANITVSHKKKKKKEKGACSIDTETLQSESYLHNFDDLPVVLSESQCKISKLRQNRNTSVFKIDDDCTSISIRKEKSEWNKQLKNRSESNKVSDELLDATKSHKKKRKHLDKCNELKQLPDMFSKIQHKSSKLKENSISFSNVVDNNFSTSKNKCNPSELQNIGNIYENNEIVEQLIDVALLHKKKKKKKEHLSVIDSQPFENRALQPENNADFYSSEQHNKYEVLNEIISGKNKKCKDSKNSSELSNSSSMIENNLLELQVKSNHVSQKFDNSNETDKVNTFEAEKCVNDKSFKHKKRKKHKYYD